MTQADILPENSRLVFRALRGGNSPVRERPES